MAKEIIKFDYNGNQIPFENGSNVMVNLTAMAKAYPDKNLTQIVNSQEIKEYCASLSKLQNYSLADLLQVRRGGDNPGTWAHRLVAIRVAQKLNSDLAVWVDMRIEELLTTGNTSLQPQLPNFNNPAEAARAWADQYEKNQTLALEVQHQQETIELQQQELTQSAPKKYLFSFGDLQNCCTFAMRHFYSHIRVGDFLCPIDSYCLKYKQRFLRTYLPQSRYGSVATWRNSLLSLFINV